MKNENRLILLFIYKFLLFSFLFDKNFSKFGIIFFITILLRIIFLNYCNLINTFFYQRLVTQDNSFVNKKTSMASFQLIIRICFAFLSTKVVVFNFSVTKGSIKKYHRRGKYCQKGGIVHYKTIFIHQKMMVTIKHSMF